MPSDNFLNNEAITLDTLVGEDRKYKTPDELAKAYHNAEGHILQIKQELAALRSATPQEAPAPVIKQPEPPVVSDADLESRIRATIQAQTEQAKREANFKQVVDVLLSTYGTEEKANDVINNKAAELGLSVDRLKELAAESPKAFLNNIGIGQPSSSFTAPRGDVNPAALHNQGGQGRVEPGTWEFYENIRKTDPTRYWSRSVQNQMHKDIQSRGIEAFGLSTDY